MNQMAKSLSFKPILITRNKSMGRQQCKKHPKHRQCPGVCSLCLSEKLAKVSLATTSRSRAAIIKARARAYYHSSTDSSSVSSTSCESSYASSNAGSPLPRYRRIASDVYSNAKEENGRLLFFSKSKSMAHVEKESCNCNKLRVSLDDKVTMKKKEKKNVYGVSKIWSNLLGLRRLSNDQKLVNVEDIHRNTSLIVSQPLPSSSSMVLAS